MSTFKPLVVKAQNALMSKKKKTAMKPTAAEASGISDSAFQSWAITTPKLLDVLTRTRPGLLGEDLYDMICQDKFVEGRAGDDENSVASAMSFATQSKYYRRFVDLAVNTDVSVKDRVKLPKTHSQLVREWEEREDVRRREEELRLEEEERRRFNEVNTGVVSDGGEGKEGEEKNSESKKNDWESDEEEEKKEEEPDIRPALPETLMNLMVLEVIFPNVAPGAPVATTLASATQDSNDESQLDGEGGGPIMMTEEEAEEKDKSTTMGKPELFQVVGVFNAERDTTPREPGGLDMGLIDWETILVASDVAKFHRTRHPLEWLSFPGTTAWGGTYFVATEKSARPWTAPDDRGVSIFNAKLKSRKNFSLAVVGAPPPKEYLMSELPRNVKRFLYLE